MPIGGLAILQKCGCNCNPQNTGTGYRYHLLIKWNYKQFVFFPSVPMEIFKNKKKVQKSDCRVTGDQDEPPTSWQCTGHKTVSALIHNPPSAHPEGPLHLYTPLALILLFWLTSVAALACGRSTNVQSLTYIVFISQKERVKSFVVVDSHQGWNHVRSLNCFQFFAKKWEYIIPKMFVKKLHLHTRTMQQKNQTASCVCGVFLCFQVMLAFPGTCDSDGSIFTSYFYTWHKYAWAAQSTASLHLLSSTVSV